MVLQQYEQDVRPQVSVARETAASTWCSNIHCNPLICASNRASWCWCPPFEEGQIKNLPSVLSALQSDKHILSASKWSSLAFKLAWSELEVGSGEGDLDPDSIYQTVLDSNKNVESKRETPPLRTWMTSWVRAQVLGTEKESNNPRAAIREHYGVVSSIKGSMLHLIFPIWLITS